jgi:hypothetical protein
MKRARKKSDNRSHLQPWFLFNDGPIVKTWKVFGAVSAGRRKETRIFLGVLNGWKQSHINSQIVSRDVGVLCYGVTEMTRPRFKVRLID